MFDLTTGKHVYSKLVMSMVDKDKSMVVRKVFFWGVFWAFFRLSQKIVFLFVEEIFKLKEYISKFRVFLSILHENTPLT